MDLGKAPKMRSAAYAVMMMMVMMMIIITNPHTKNTITCSLKFSGDLNGPVKKVPR